MVSLALGGAAGFFVGLRKRGEARSFSPPPAAASVTSEPTPRSIGVPVTSTALTTPLATRLREALTQPDEFSRGAAWQSLLDEMTAEEARDVRAIFRECDKEGRWFPREFEAFWLKWGEVSGLAAMDELQGDPTLRHTTHLYARVAEGWARRDASSVKAWLAANQETALNPEHIQKGLVLGLASTTLTAATDYVTSLGPSANSDHLASEIAWTAVYQRGLPAAQEWLKNLWASPQSADLPLQRATRALAEASLRGGPESLDAFVKSIPRAAGLQQMIPEVVERWAGGNGMSVLECVDSLPPEYFNEHAVNRLLENWNVKDLDAMGLWLRENRDFRFYNLAAERYAQTLDDVDPAAARQWRDSLKENQPR